MFDQHLHDLLRLVAKNGIIVVEWWKDVGYGIYGSEFKSNDSELALDILGLKIDGYLSSEPLAEESWMEKDAYKLNEKGWSML